MNLKIYPVATVQGEMRPPSDKSLTHRSYMLGAIANGPSVVEKPLRSEDCESTLRCLEQMGLKACWNGAAHVTLTPASDWDAPTSELDCGNSGTTIRLISGLIASRPIRATLTGDRSLRRRPMGRIATPLRQMGANFLGEQPPIQIQGSDSLQAIRYDSPVASGQIKSCILFAGLRSEGETVVIEPSLSRDHTERMLRAMGVNLISSGGQAVATRKEMAVLEAHEVRLTPSSHLEPFHLKVPGDISSAAFFMVAAAILPSAQIILTEVSINPTRTGIFDVFEQAGVELRLGNESEQLGEPIADLEVKSSRQDLRPFTIQGALIPRLIDEIPALAVLASQCSGTSHIKDASELRVKESDRIELIAIGLRAMGVAVETHPDGMSITGPCRLQGSIIDCHGDHRIAMAFAVAGLIADGETVIEGAECISTSFPTFSHELERLSIV